MYRKDLKEKLIEIKNLPAVSVGAPCPVIYATEHEFYVTYYLQSYDPAWDGTYVRIVDENSTTEPSIIVEFKMVLAHYFGMPNDEALSGHPLYTLGLKPYSYFEVLNSLWIDKHEKMNRVHPSHKKELYEDYRHFIFTFHDTTLEVIAEDFSYKVTNKSLLENIESIIRKNS